MFVRIAVDLDRRPALDRTQPGLPLKKGRAGTMTHDYKRNGTTTLLAALDVATDASHQPPRLTHLDNDHQCGIVIKCSD